MTERILVVDDDQVFRERLTRALSRRGFDATSAADAAEAKERCGALNPSKLVIDLKMPGESGLDFLEWLRESRPDTQVVMLTGYGSIATAIEAMRRGAVNYLTKPADADQIVAAFAGKDRAPVGDRAFAVPTLDLMEWEHINRVVSECGGNISKASKVLGIHRRSLQRKLSKIPSRRAPGSD